MVFFRRSSLKSSPKIRAKSRFIPSLTLRFLRRKSKPVESTEPTESAVEPVSDAVQRPVSRATSIYSFQRPVSRAVTVQEMDMPSSHSLSSASSSIYSDQDQASIVSMPSLATDDTSPPDSPIIAVPERRRPVSTHFEFERPSTSYELSPETPFSTPFSNSPSSLKRQASLYSHRSFNVQRDSFRPPTAIPSIFEKPSEPTIAEDDCLILTMTSKYPTGIAAELYVPEDLSYDVVMRKQREERKAQLRESFNRNLAVFRKNSIRSSIRPSDDKDLEKKKAKRMSVNF